MKKWLLIIPVLLAILVGVFGYSWWTTQAKPVGSDEKPVALVVVPGETGQAIAQKLVKANLVRSELVTRVYMRTAGIETKVQPGSYVLQKTMSLPEIFTQLLQGPQDIWVTIPEGWRREQIAKRMSDKLGTEFFSTSEFLVQTDKLEGQLFPDTYLIPAEAQAADIVRILTANFASKSGLTLPADKDILILASLIEREGKSSTDRPVISGILTNRLDIGMALQVDATVQFGRDSATCKGNIECDWWSPLYDSQIPSSYNTYLHPGLPPGPIANPGLSSIQAASEPASTPYFYYIHADDGTAYYATTLTGHNANVDKYLKP